MDYGILIFVPIIGIPLTIAYLAYRRSVRKDKEQLQNRVRERIAAREKTQQRVQAQTALDNLTVQRTEPVSIDVIESPNTFEEKPNFPNIERTEPLCIMLMDTTEILLGLNYAPYRWPETNEIDAGFGFTINEPWIGHIGKRWYAKNLAKFKEGLGVLGSHSNSWVKAKCTAALIPDADGKIFSVIVNGVVLSKELSESSSLRRRMLLAKMEIKPTLCNAVIYSKGSLNDPGKSSFSVTLDLKKFRYR